jgi:cobalt-zinc-cadmium efflux system membrane fusion protein
MNKKFILGMLLGIALTVAAGFFMLSAERKVTAQGPAEAAPGPAPATVVADMDPNNFKVEKPERFQLSDAGEHVAAPQLNVTGQVSPDVSRQVPVPSLATGKIIEIDARLGDEVKKGQLLFKVHSQDINGAYSDYRQATKNEQLSKIQLDRAKLLYEHGAIPKSALEIAQTTEDVNVITLETTKEHLRVLGSDPDHPSATVSVFAPVSGVITDQQITASSGVQALTPPNPFTISDLSRVWIMCDVYENDLAQVHVGEFADIHLVAYPNRVLKAKINNILPVMDPNLRTAKVRLEVENPGLLRFGMFVTATFHGLQAQKNATVPSTAILHLHDREWVYVPLGDGKFKRQEVTGGNMLPGGQQEVLAGLKPGDKVVTIALVFQNTVEQ